MPPKTKTHSLARVEAEAHGLDTLVRCYWREIAAPAGLVQINAAAYPGYPGLSPCPLAPHRPYVAVISMPHVQATILAPLDRHPHIGIPDVDRYWLRRRNSCEPLNWKTFADLLLRELSAHFGQLPAAELREQLGLSVDVSTMILASRRPQGVDLGDPDQAYIQSEQSLLRGHPYHPTPKARSGLLDSDLTTYSPEVGAKFSLHYFAVKRDAMVQHSILAADAQTLIAAEGPSHLLSDPSWALIPVHPWQAGYLLGLESVKAALQPGAGQLLRYLGAYGPEFSPTASVRTLFASSSRFFYKTSLSFRITNCLRRNALPELAGALRISSIMRDLKIELSEHFPSFYPLEEQAYLSVCLPSTDESERRKVTEGFGLMLRETIEAKRQVGEVCLVAAALFGNAGGGRGLIRRLLATASARYPQLPRLDLAKRWFAAYLEQLIGPLIYLYNQAGIMFEPHLQNIVVGFADGWPRAVYLRDYENARLVASRLKPRLALSLSREEQEELLYPEDKAELRFTYCLFTNHIHEAVRQLSYACPEIEADLWDLVRVELGRCLRRFPSAHPTSLLEGLLKGRPFPAKTNLITRFTAGKDALASYVPIGSPWRQNAEYHARTQSAASGQLPRALA